MKSLILNLLNILIILTAIGCGSPAMHKSAASDDLVTEPVNPDKARICVLRISSGIPLLPGKVRDGERKMGSLRPNTYLCWEREPGEAAIRSSTAPLLSPIEYKQDVYELRLTVEAGNVYYLMQQWRLTKPRVRLRLAVLDEEYALKKLAECTRVRTKEE